MTSLIFEFGGQEFAALGSGALHWPSERILIVSDLHLGKSERIARRSGHMLPPYETEDTLLRLDAIIRSVEPKTVICLGDSFDDLQAGQNLRPEAASGVNALMAGREWIWIEGNHDPGPVDFGGTHLSNFTHLGISFRHIAAKHPENFEVSGHYHPKAKLTLRARTVSRPCFLFDQRRMILPSFGTYTGGLFCTHPTLEALLDSSARAILTGPAPHLIPMPRSGR